MKKTYVKPNTSILAAQAEGMICASTLGNNTIGVGDNSADGGFMPKTNGSGSKGTRFWGYDDEEEDNFTDKLN